MQLSGNSQSIRPPKINKLFKKGRNQWGFGSEEALEDFIWDNLSNLLELTPLKRQYKVNGGFCDILALDKQKQLVIIELKNVEDPRVVQQLTRYYNNLITVKPFDLGIDYSNSIRLMAIMPSFHQQNFIDQEYSKLALEFLWFKIVKEESRFFLSLTHLDTKQVTQAEIPYNENEISDLESNLSDPPGFLLTIIENQSSEQQEYILRLRKYILCFHEKIEEINSRRGVIKYGRGKNNICIEICQKIGSKDPDLYLYLPIPDRRNRNLKYAIGRMVIFLKNDWKNIYWIGYISQQKLYSYKHFEKFIQVTDSTEPPSQLENLVNIALEHWLERL
ncbi:endonuclease NucS domain-containing protein [Planktothrix paucivesiculata]|uniref:Endonuclease NucS C-terminal domain-containing protein n=1 Tax=Planktothrix paucivesiculata PCC 9631 TaxID=671071 RepID=A0A7Z9BTV7_9CYAN|nr:endonuclease NucS domain-containing protein [Planktothrix paucivesiculata]VXD21131.1 conserved hypothetical protein [Planktothrix paucivesiculata PCC 9631]